MLIPFLIALVLPITGWLTFDKLYEPVTFGAVSTFKSIQLASDPDNGECLTTNGSNNTWSTDCGEGGGGGGSIGTSTAVSGGQVAYWTDSDSLSGVATGTLSESVTGLEFSASRSLIGGASALSLTSGFNIPLTASTSAWQTFYATPSNRITAGTGIDWSANTLNGVYTAGDGITLTGEDFDCDIASGSVFGCLSTAFFTLFNNKVASTSIDTESELETLLTDVTNVFTNNDGALADDDLTNNSIEDLSDVTTFTQAGQDLLYYNGANWDRFAKGSNGEVLQTNSSGNLDWVATGTLGISGGTPGGSDTQIQFNNAGAFGGAAPFTYNSAAQSLAYYSALDASRVYLDAYNTAETVGAGLGIATDVLGTSQANLYALDAGGQADFKVFPNKFTFNANPIYASSTIFAQTPASGPRGAVRIFERTGGEYYDALITSFGDLALRSSSQGTTTIIDDLGTIYDGAYDSFINLHSFDGIQMGSGSYNAIELTDTGGNKVVLNQDSADADFRVETNNDANALFIDGGTDDIGVGTSSPASRFVVRGNGVASVFSVVTNAATKIIDILETGVVTLLGAWDFGGATSVELPNSANCTTDAAGETCFDTSDMQFQVATTTNANSRAIPTITKLWGRTVASTSVDFISGGRQPLTPHRDGVVITEIHCYVDGGTSKVINIDTMAGGAQTDSLTCGTTLTSDTALPANTNLSAGALMAVEFGATTGTVDYVTFSVWGYIKPE